MTRRGWFAGIAGALLTPAFITLWKRHQQRRERERVLTHGKARTHALGLMNEEEVEAYVDRMIHEYREEVRSARPAAEVLPNRIGEREAVT